MKKTLRPFQQAGADFLSKNYHALLGDQPGLGKTLQAVAAVEKLSLQEILVVCPASVRGRWHDELTECGVPTICWDIISYNEAVDGRRVLRNNYDAVIMDECHFLKTSDSQRTQAIFGNGTGLARRARYKWGLTGTPVLNRPVELYPILKTLATPAIAPYDSFARFTQRFCGAYYDGRGLNVRGASHLDDLRNRLSGFMLRRTKKEVMPELPSTIVSKIPLKISPFEMQEILNLENEISDRESYLSPTVENFAQLGDMAALLRITGLAKARVAVEFIEELLQTVNKIVVFGHHRGVLDKLAAGIGVGSVVYRGGMNDDEKREAVDRFVHDANTRIFFGNIKAAGTGIDGLQKVCDTVVFAELSWVPGEMDQAMDRLNRMGQDNVVTAYVLHVPGTLESAMLHVHDAKNKVIKRLYGW